MTLSLVLMLRCRRHASVGSIAIVTQLESLSHGYTSGQVPGVSVLDDEMSEVEAFSSSRLSKDSDVHG